MPDDDYSRALSTDARDLVELARTGHLARATRRAALAERALEQLDAGRSVLLVGAPGAGKSAVIGEVAHRLAERDGGGLFEISTALLLSGTRYIGEWQTKVTATAKAAIARGAVLCVTDVWNLARVGRTVQSTNTMLEALRPFLERKGGLRLLGEVTPDVLREMHRVPGFVALFQTIEVHALGAADVDAVLRERGETRGVSLEAPSLRALVDLTGRFEPARPQPGPALRLLDQVVDYREQKAGIGESAAVDRAFIERVFSIHSGLPPFVVSREAALKEREIRDWFAARIIGQDEAIRSIVETIALFKAGLHDATKPIGTFLFVGPTGVGKTEVARSLATFIFGSPQRMLRFDLSEFKDYSSFELLLGDPDRPDAPARLLGPVRGQPFQVVLFDELEKAHPNVWDLLLPLLDEGRLTGPAGDLVDFRNTILIATSNVGAQDAQDARALGFGATGSDPGGARAKIRRALEQQFRPEFLNRFQHVVVFHALSTAQMRRIARQEVDAVLAREGLASRDLALDVEDAALDLVIARGVDTRFGARALKREVQRHIVVPLAMTLMEKPVDAGAVLRVSVKDGQLRVRVIETDASRAAAATASEAAKAGVTRAEVLERMTRADARIVELARAVGEDDFERARDDLHGRRAEPDFWKDVERVIALQGELDRLVTIAERLERLRGRAADLRTPLAPRAGDAPRLDRLASHVGTLEEAIDDAFRECVTLSWLENASAIVEVRPLGPSGARARRVLVDTYLGWAGGRRMATDWIREPCEDSEPAVFVVKGAWAYGYLRDEAGLHRMRAGGAESEPSRVAVAAVRVAACSERRGDVVVWSERALKARGQFGGKVRSRLECRATTASGALVLQNARSLSENKELAAELVASWSALDAPSEDVVRRYDEDPLLIRDARTAFVTGKPDALAPARFDALLKKRIDARTAR